MVASEPRRARDSMSVIDKNGSRTNGFPMRFQSAVLSAVTPTKAKRLVAASPGWQASTINNALPEQKEKNLPPGFHALPLPSTPNSHLISDRPFDHIVRIAHYPSSTRASDPINSIANHPSCNRAGLCAYSPRLSKAASPSKQCA